MQRRTRIALIILSVFGLMFLLSIVGLYRIITAGTVARIPDKSILELNLNGAYQDSAPEDDWPAGLLTREPRTISHIRSALAKAKVDHRIRAVLLNISGLGVGWGAAQEIREAIEDFKSSGKPVTAFLELAQDKDYFVAVAADKVYLAPEGLFLLNGLSLEAQFLKDIFDKLGVKADYHHIGEYKSASETYTRNTMSDAQREALNALADGFYKQMIDAIAKGRKLPPEEVERYINDFQISNARIVEAHLLDGLLYYDQVVDSLKAPGQDEPHRVQLAEYARVNPQSLGLETGPKVAVLFVAGEITSGSSGRPGLFGGLSAGSDTIVEAIQDIREDDDIKAVILRVDSPGGSTLASDVMWRELELLRQKKPIIVSMSDLAASGGYWIATTGDVIIAQPGTITGSIGVIFGKFNVKELLDKVGYRVEVVSRGQHAQMFSPLQGFSEPELKKVDAMLRETYDTFINKVAKARNMTPVDVDKIARGRVWTGEQAKERGLVDELGGMSRAIALAREKGKIDAKAEIDLVMFPQEGTFLERLLGGLGVHASQSALPPELERALSVIVRDGPQLDPGPMAILPFVPVLN